MAITHPIGIRQELCNLVVDKMDSGGVLRYQTSGAATIADGTLSTPAWGAADGSATSTANSIGNATNNTGSTQTVAQFTFRDASSDVFSGSVTTSGGGGDMIITNTSIADSESIQTNSATYTGPA